MAYSKTNWINDNVPAINATNLNHIEQGIYENSLGLENLISNLFPIGQIVIKGDNEDYSNWLGFTWERTAVGKVLVGYDSSDEDFDIIGETGGEKNVTLRTSQIPGHQHQTSTSRGPVLNWDGGTLYGYQYGGTSYSSSGANDLTSLVTGSTGGGQAHNNLQPYQVVAYWKRIA